MSWPISAVGVVSTLFRSQLSSSPCFERTSVELLKWKGESLKLGIIVGIGDCSSGRFIDLLFWNLPEDETKALKDDLFWDVLLWRDMYAPLGVKPVDVELP